MNVSPSPFSEAASAYRFTPSSLKPDLAPVAPLRLSEPVMEEPPQTHSLVTSALQAASKALFGQAEFLSKACDELKAFAKDHNAVRTFGHAVAQGALCCIAALSTTLGYILDIALPAAVSVLMGATLTATFVGLIILLCTNDPIGNLARFGSTVGYLCSTPFHLLSECCLNATHIDDEAKEARHEQLKSARIDISEVSAGIGAVIGLIGGLVIRVLATR